MQAFSEAAIEYIVRSFFAIMGSAFYGILCYSALSYIGQSAIHILQLPIGTSTYLLLIKILAIICFIYSFFVLMFGTISKSSLVKSIPVNDASIHMGYENWLRLKRHYKVGDEIWLWRTPAWTWRALMGREGFVLLRNHKVTRYSVVTGMN
jgi:hypothetical protein